MRIAAIVLLGVLPGLSFAATQEGSEASALHWLQRMVKAIKTENYIGRFVYLHDGQLETLEVRHFATPDGEKSHLIALNGAAVEVLHDGQQVICVLPDGVSVNQYAVPKGLSPLVPDDPERLARAYELRLLGTARVANRSTVVLGVLPRDGFRYGLRLFLDRKTALPLQADKLDIEGRVLSRILFVSLMAGAEVAGFDDELVLPPIEAGRSIVSRRGIAHRSVTSETKPKWRFTDLPSGYRLAQRRLLSGEADESTIEQYIFSDGLSSFSVYLEPGTTGGADGLVHVGAVHAYGRMLGDGHVTIVGEVPGDTVVRVARGIMPLAAENPTLAGAPPAPR